MRSPTANVLWRLILSACVLSTLGACETAPKVVTEYVPVEVQVPVVVKIDPDLLKPCIVRYRYKPTGMPIADMRERLAAVEDALAICWNQIENIAAAQNAPPK